MWVADTTQHPHCLSPPHLLAGSFTPAALPATDWGEPACHAPAVSACDTCNCLHVFCVPAYVCVCAPVPQVPWKEVVDRWKAVRQRWSKTLKVAETPQQFAGLMAELHDHLRTDKASGLFASNGPWENGLMACVRGEAGMSALLGLWEDMKTAIQVCVGGGRGGQHVFG